jgi:sialic acid synthase SpsE/quercetin dioxygenase-like cupin family protein
MISFKDLFIFEMANNHQGELIHGLKIISEMGKIAREYRINAAVKLQYRHLDTFIHPLELNNKENKHVSRFLSTRLKDEEFKELVNAIKKEGMLTVCTPFDEVSVELIIKHEIDCIKIASCSADDWPLITRIAEAKKPVIASTGGLEIWEVDNLVSYLTHRLDQVGILHCVALYPAPNSQINLKFLETLKSRYRGITIGYSGHEDPDNTDIAKVAVSLGAKILERHVGVETEKIKLNQYSMNPSQTRKWIEAVLTAREILGEKVRTVKEDERSSLFALKRGVFAGKELLKGDYLKREEVFFAFPISPGQLTSGSFGKVRARYSTTKKYKKYEPVFETTTLDSYHKIRRIIHEAKGLINQHNIDIGKGSTIELSHHYGIEKFEKFGCLIVNVINREYCKKIIVMFPGQHHPEQKHLKKEETFHILRGDLNITLNGIPHALSKGDIVTIERGVLHSFYSDAGTIIEEVSTTHHVDDSFYTDPLISEQDPMQRKTVLEKY